MATREQLELIAKSLLEVENLTRTCPAVVEALIEADLPIMESGLLAVATEYQRARRRILTISDTCQRSVRWLRGDALSPELIRVDSTLSKVKSDCERCIEHNSARLGCNEPFECLVQKRDERTPLRLRIDANGDITHGRG